jgi:peptidoglycan/xylan/chitin deacetylase (PgdA/CDA1 family)
MILMRNKSLAILVIAVSVLGFNVNFGQQAASSKKISVTIDDLPFNRVLNVSNDEMKSYVEKLLDKIKSQKIPVIAFVNENKLETNGKRDPERVQILKMWLDAGAELGNHTYSHKSANQISIEEYENEILKGERTIKELLAEKNLKPRYFRHPFLHTGLSLDYRDEVNKFLEALFVSPPLSTHN